LRAEFDAQIQRLAAAQATEQPQRAAAARPVERDSVAQTGEKKGSSAGDARKNPQRKVAQIPQHQIPGLQLVEHIGAGGLIIAREGAHVEAEETFAAKLVERLQPDRGAAAPGIGGPRKPPVQTRPQRPARAVLHQQPTKARAGGEGTGGLGEQFGQHRAQENRRGRSQALMDRLLADHLLAEQPHQDGLLAQAALSLGDQRRAGQQESLRVELARRAAHEATAAAPGQQRPGTPGQPGGEGGGKYGATIRGGMYNSIYTSLLSAQLFPARSPAMGYPVKIQRVQRSGTCSYYVNFPVAIAEAIEAAKGETWGWSLEDKNTLLFQRLEPKTPRKLKSKPTP
jgi:hypothetical protein